MRINKENREHIVVIDKLRMKRRLAQYMNITLRGWSILHPASISADGGHCWRLVEQQQLRIPFSPGRHDWHSNHCVSHCLYFDQTKTARNE